MNRTKIVATMGPSTSDKEVLREMTKSGVNVCRLNFSHGTHEDHEKIIKNIRALDKEDGRHTAILGDLQGPKLRVGEMGNGGVELEEGKKIVFTTEKVKGTSEKVYMNYRQFPADVNVGEKILLDDGKIHMEVLDTNGTSEVEAKILTSGILKSNKGVNLPNTKVSLPSLTEKDLKDLEFALDNDVDWIGLSFVRSGRDIIELNHIIQKHKKHSRVIAKIEKPEALDDIDAIIKEAGGLMVARGDLGVEIPLENVPLIQKMLVRKCLRMAKPVIIATQMMESMIEHVSPTRAEVNDVANAVMDGTDAVMLSGETSIGKHPVKVIKTMSSIVERIESGTDKIYYEETAPEKNQDRFISDSICFNACRLSKRVDAEAIVTMTHSGYTAYKISSQRPRARVFVFTGNKKIMKMLSLVWGVHAFYYDKMVSTDHTIADIKYLLRKEGYLKEGDLVINIASMPIEEKGNSNMLKLSHV